jgi:hypothetical protein
VEGAYDLPRIGMPEKEEEIFFCKLVLSHKY